MAKKIQKLAMLLSLAAMFMFTSCGKEEAAEFAPGIADSVVTGTWRFLDVNENHPNITILPDHTCIIKDYTYIWSINGRSFHGFYRFWDNTIGESIKYYVDFDIKNITDTSMTISGHRTWSDGSRTDYSGDLARGLW